MSLFYQFIQRLRQWRLRLSRSELLVIIGGLASVAFVGMVAYALIEGWSLLDALYATVITMTTVGYGDFTPKTPVGRLFAIFFTIMAIAIGGYSISTLAAYTIERRSQRIAGLFRRRTMERIQALQQHYILCGVDLLGLRISEELHIHHAPFVIIDADEEAVKRAILYSQPEYFQQKIKTLIDFHQADLSHLEDLSLPQLSDKFGIPYLLAAATDDSVLIQAGIERAAGLIATYPDDRDNLSVVIGARSLANRANNSTLRIMTRATDPNAMRKLYLAGADFVRIPSIMSGMEMASHMLHPEIGNWWYSRLEDGIAKRSMFEQMNLSERPHWVGQTVAQLHQSAKTVVVAVKRNGTFITPPPHDLRFLAEDVLIVVR